MNITCLTPYGVPGKKIFTQIINPTANKSILNTIKKMLNISIEETGFDEDIVVGINTAFMKLNQLGIGPVLVFTIEDAEPKWTDFLGPNLARYSAVKSYIYLVVRETFDPPSSAHVLTAIQKQIEELGWRLNVQLPPVEEVP